MSLLSVRAWTHAELYLDRLNDCMPATALPPLAPVLLLQTLRGKTVEEVEQALMDRLVGYIRWVGVCLRVWGTSGGWEFA